MGVLAIERRFSRKSTRVKITDIRTQRGSRVGALEIPRFAAGRRPEQRERLLTRGVIVIDAGNGILIVEQREVRGEAERGQQLITRLRADLLIIVQAGSEVGSAARRDFGF